MHLLIPAKNWKATLDNPLSVASHFTANTSADAADSYFDIELSQLGRSELRRRRRKTFDRVEVIERILRHTFSSKEHRLLEDKQRTENYPQQTTIIM
jgi:hypothetical protein